MYTCIHAYMDIYIMHICICIVVCTEPSGKKPRRRVYVGRVIISGSLCEVMVRTLAQNARDNGTHSCSRHNISHFQHIHNNGCHDHDPVQARLHAAWLLNLHCVYI